MRLYSGPVKIFVLGTGRCGTVSVAHAISKAGNFVLHEGSEVGGGVRLSPLFEANKFIYYDSRNSKVTHAESINLSGPAYNMLKRTFAPRERVISSMSNKDVYCDVNPYGYSHINYILDIYPDAKFIHLIRNGEDVVRSYIGRNYTYPNIPENKYSTYASGKPRPYAGDLFLKEWSGWDRVQKTSWFWKFVNEDIEERLSGVSESNKIMLKIEDLNSYKLKEVLSSFGACCDNVSINILNKSRAPVRRKVDTGKFFDIGSTLMRKYGYYKDAK